MILARVVLIAALALAAPVAATAADDILDAIDQARKSYQDGNYTAAKQSLDLASQLVGQKNAESFAAAAAGGAARLEGREGRKPPLSASPCSAPPRRAAAIAHLMGTTSRCASPATSALVMQFAQLFLNPVIAGAMGKLIKIGDQRGIQTSDGTINMVVNNKYLVTVEGSADAAAKLAYAQAVDIAKLSKM